MAHGDKYKIMIFATIILFTAVLLSAVAAWYSIAGLTAIFSAAVIPVIIMGATMELGKVVATVWLHNNWKRINWAFKSYLIPAILFLMVLTSMGIFGFLSKAHSDQNLVSGDAMSKVAIYDEKITTEKDNIAQAKKALEQMNSQVDQMLGRSDNETGAQRAVNIRKGQAKERASLQAEITKSQKIIQQLQEERAPIAAEFRKVEAEVGPIKYIAALIYGDNPDANVLERAVRWVIILIVVVFDPLALCLILAGNKQIEWTRADKIAKRKEDIVEAEEEIRDVNAFFDSIRTQNAIEKIEDEQAEIEEANSKLAEIQPEPKIEVVEPEVEEFFDKANEVAQAIDKDEYQAPELEPVTDFEAIAESKEPLDLTMAASSTEMHTTDVLPIGEELDTVSKEAISGTRELYHQIQGSDYVTFEGKQMHMRVLRDLRPDLFTNTSASNFGNKFPETALMGDIYIRVDVLPHRVFKFNGKKWIEIDKTQSEGYLSDNKYVQYIVDKISTGEIDPEMLSDSEQDAVANLIRKS
jgi:hypothetical protein